MGTTDPFDDLTARLAVLAANKEHHGPRSGFQNPWPSFIPHGMMDFLKVTRLTEWDSKRSKPQPIPTTHVDWATVRAPPPDASVVTWIGHASFLWQADGWNVLTDPIFSNRCSPVQWAGPKRFTQPACSLEQLPRLDAVVISHNHYDHTDAGTITALAKLQPKTFWLVPLGNAALLRSLGVAADRVVELDWWGQAVLSKTVPSHEAALAPAPTTASTAASAAGASGAASGAAGGGGTDDSPASGAGAPSTLNRLRVGGDTGYRALPKGVPDTVEERAKLPACPVFKTIGDTFGGFDIGLIPIGAYSPRVFMSSVHVSPDDAVELHTDVRAARSFGMHHGTFILTDEPVTEPPKLLATAVARHGLPPDSFTAVPIGQTTVVPFTRRDGAAAAEVTE